MCKHFIQLFISTYRVSVVHELWDTLYVYIYLENGDHLRPDLPVDEDADGGEALGLPQDVFADVDALGLGDPDDESGVVEGLDDGVIQVTLRVDHEQIFDHF